MTNTETLAGRLANWICLAAAPAFAAMAVLGASNPAASMICGRTTVINDMTLMYLFMSIMHLPPWLRAWRH
jgi:hypothetical protein